MGKNQPITRASNSSRRTTTKIPMAQKADLSMTERHLGRNRQDQRPHLGADKNLYEMKNLQRQATGRSGQETEDITTESNTIDERLIRLECHDKCRAIQILELLNSPETDKLAIYACASTSTSNDKLHAPLP